MATGNEFRRLTVANRPLARREAKQKVTAVIFPYCREPECMVNNGKAGFAGNNPHSIDEHLGPEMALSRSVNAAAKRPASTKMVNTDSVISIFRDLRLTINCWLA